MSSSPVKIFISSVQKEMQEERYAIRDFVQNDALLKQFFTVFLFEDLPAVDQRPDALYLDEVKDSPIYVGLFGNEYGWEDEDGLSPTEKEFRHASELRTRRLVFIKGSDDSQRVPKMKALIRQAEDELVRKRFLDTEELLRLLYGSLVHYLQDEEVITTRDFDARKCDDATLDAISPEKVEWFLKAAKAERGYALAVDTPLKDVLAHLNLLVGEQPSTGAVLLFGEKPIRYMHSADVNCLHFHGTEVAKPIPSQQIYRGTLFEMVDEAVDFVMARLARSVTPGKNTVASDVRYEIPYPVVREAIVNAVAHRNYASNASVQVMLFSDRIEVWNPGGLPGDLTVDQLRLPHHSVPRNHLLCEPLFLARYIERAGTGTLDMIRLCAEAGLPEPQFRNEGEHFVSVIWRDWLTNDVLAGLGLNERQKKAVWFAKTNGEVSNSHYREIAEVSDSTALRDLRGLVKLGVLIKRGGTGRGASYAVAQNKPAINPSNPPKKAEE